MAVWVGDATHGWPGGCRTGEGDRVEGISVIRWKSRVPLKNEFSSLLQASNEKLLNTKSVQNFKIYNFCFRHLFI
jgi:hypothetical protein